mgnify:FL=1
MEFGIVSLGSHAINRVMPAILSSDNKITAIYSTDRQKGTKYAKEVGAEFFDDLEKMMHKDFQAAYISSPNYLHYKFTKLALTHDKHVLLEKPMTLSVRESKELHDIAQQKGLRLSIGFHLRFHPSLDYVREAISKGELGEIRLVSGQWSHFSSRNFNDSWWGVDYMVGGGSIVGTGVHVMDAIYNIFREEPKGLIATSYPKGRTIDDHFNIIFDYGESRTAIAISSRKIPDGNNDLVIQGERGYIRVKNFFSTSVDSKIETNGIIREVPKVDMYREEIKDFVGKGLKIANSYDGVISTAMHLGAQFSAKEGRYITLKEILGT